ncbi:hypothetical protein LG632_27925, partial [Streptomyces sp. SMC 277]|nr:hypothetical protein [Streptomyces antimicrobicus]
ADPYAQIPAQAGPGEDAYAYQGQDQGQDAGHGHGGDGHGGYGGHAEQQQPYVPAYDPYQQPQGHPPQYGEQPYGHPYPQQQYDAYGRPVSYDPRPDGSTQQ